MLHCVGGARFSNQLNVYRRQRIDPHNLGFAQTAQLSTTHHLRDLSSQRDGQVRCEEKQKLCTWRGRGHSLFQRHERAVHGNIRCWLKMGRRSVVSSVRRRWRHRQWCLNGRRIIPADLCRTQTQSCFLKAVTSTMVDGAKKHWLIERRLVSPQDVGEPLSEACHGELRLPLVADCWSSTGNVQLAGVLDSRFSIRLVFFFP